MCSFLQKPTCIGDIFFRQKDVLSWKMIARHHSKVLWTGGYAPRFFELFSWLEVGSVKVSLSRPAHQRVPL
jgi:hypothetical protein